MKLNISTLTDAILDISYGKKNKKAITVNISSAQYNLEWIIYNINKQNEDCKNIYTTAIISYNNIILTKKNIEDCIFIGPNGIIIKFIVNELYKDNITITATVGDNIKCKEIKFDDLIILPDMEKKNNTIKEKFIALIDMLNTINLQCSIRDKRQTTGVFSFSLYKHREEIIGNFHYSIIIKFKTKDNKTHDILFLRSRYKEDEEALIYDEAYKQLLIFCLFAKDDKRKRPLQTISIQTLIEKGYESE